MNSFWCCSHYKTCIFEITCVCADALYADPINVTRIVWSFGTRMVFAAGLRHLIFPFTLWGMYYWVQMPAWPPSADVPCHAEYDFIVVGAGAAGAVVATRLSEIHHWRVLLIEAGVDPPIDSVVPGLQANLYGSQYDWGYYSSPDLNSGLSQVTPGVFPVTKGKMLGGTSSINSFFYVRGNPEDYNGWARLGLPGWDWHHVLPYFLKSEGLDDQPVLHDPVYGGYHNHSGPLVVSRPRYVDPNVKHKLDIIRHSLTEIGLPAILDANGPTQIGVSDLYYTHSKPPGVRSSTAQTYLLPARDRKNLQVLKNGHVTKVLIDEHNNAIGVEAITKRGVQRFYAAKEVIVSAGAVNTAKILMSSGIGPKEDVLSLGVKSVVDLPVGHDMQNHIHIPLVFTGGATPEDLQPNQTEVKITLDTVPMPMLHGFFSLDGSSVPDIELMAAYLNQSSPQTRGQFEGFGYNEQVVSSFLRPNEDHEFFLIVFTLLSPASRGRISVKTVEPSVQPEIYQGFLTHPDDMEVVVEGIKRFFALRETSYLKKTGSRIVQPDLPTCDQFQFLSNEYLRCYIRHLTINEHHEVGTCAMGRVVDGDLKVYGVGRLRVVDAGVMPLLTRGNTYAPTVMIAEKISDVIKNYYLG